MTEFRSNVAWTLVGNVTYAASQWAMLAALTKILSPEKVGIFAWGLALTAPLILFSNLNLRAVQVTDAEQAFEQVVYFRLRLVTTLGALAGIGLTAWWQGPTPEAVTVILLLGVSKAIESMADVIYGEWQRREHMRRIALSLMARGVFSLLAFVSILAGTRQVVPAVAAQVLVWAILLAVDFRTGGFSLQPILARRDWKACWPLAQLAAPLGLVMLLNSLTANLPRYLIQKQLGEGELGIFAALGYLLLAGTTIVNALGQTASPRLARFFSERDVPSFRQLLTRLVLLALATGASGVGLLALAGTHILTWLYQPLYAARLDVALWLMVAGALSYSSTVFGYGITAARIFKTQVPFNLIELGLLWAAGSWLIPHFGLPGAAWSMCLSIGVHLTLKIAILHKALGKHTRASNQPLKVLHVMGRMQRGGAEMRLVDVLEHLNPKTYQTHILTLSGLPGELDETVCRLGGKVIPMPINLWLPFRFCRLLARERYQAVQSHVHFFSGFMVFLAWMERVPVRLVQVHSTSDGQPPTFRRRCQTNLMKWLIDRFATHIVAVSQGVLDASCAEWQQDLRCRVLYNGLNPAMFEQAGGAAQCALSVRQEFDIPVKSPLVIHVGRMDPEKNHLRLVSMFAHLVHLLPEVHLLLVGKPNTPIVEEVRDLAEKLGIADRIRIAGTRMDVPRLLTGADLLWFPSCWEGLPGVVIEALAAGVPVLATDLPGVKEIAAQLPGVTSLSLAAPDTQWAQVAAGICTGQVFPSGPPPRLEAFRASPFTIGKHVETLCTFWHAESNYEKPAPSSTFRPGTPAALAGVD